MKMAFKLSENTDWGFSMMATKVVMPRLLTQPHQNYNYSIEQPSLGTARYRAEWKSYKDRIKEET